MTVMAQCEATWHVYEEHPDVWVQFFGYRQPKEPDPRKSVAPWAQLN